MKDIELLHLELDTGSGTDDYGREEAAPVLAIAVASDGRLMVDHSPVCPTSAPLDVSGGPSYLIESTPAPYGGTILTSDRAVPDALHAARPERWWEPREWSDLLAGKLGPWAIAFEAERVSALCHTPRGRDSAAEAGVWTHPDDRRRGLASAVTAAWAAVARSRYDVLFYSTSADNVGSQGVARRLGLRPLGWIWQLRQQR